jgi:hypothetical protein
MEHRAAVTSLSWIPSEAIVDAPLLKATFTLGFTHYDAPPPDDVAPDAVLEDLADDDVFRFAHRLAAVVEVEDGRVVAARYGDDSRGVMGGTTVRLPGWSTRLEAVHLPVLRQEPVVRDTSATFRQTFGGYTGLPAPRRVTGAPLARWRAPVVWTTLTLTVDADGRSEFDLAGASAFPRHWIYGPEGALARKSGLTEFNDWYHGAHGRHTPWGDEDNETLVVDVESELERGLSTTIMRRGERPEVRHLDEGDVLIAQGEGVGPVYLVLDGVLAVDVDGEELGELGPGAVVGERAWVEGGPRTATLRARTAVRVAAARPGQVDQEALRALVRLHRREDDGPPDAA